MMPVAENTQHESPDYKKKYKTLKKKLKLLLHEHECFLEELRKSQRKLLKVSRDRSFLLDRLLQYENVEDSSSDSELTASSESETEGLKETSPTKKKRAMPHIPGLPPMYGDNAALMEAMGYAPASSSSTAQQIPPVSSGTKNSEPPKKKAKVTKKSKTAQSKQSAGSATSVAGLMAAAASRQQQQQATTAGTMTREELERHLEFKQSNKPQYMSLGQAMNTLPDDIFGNEDSNQGSFSIMGLSKDEDDSSNLIIDANTD